LRRLAAFGSSDSAGCCTSRIAAGFPKKTRLKISRSRLARISHTG